MKKYTVGHIAVLTLGLAIVSINLRADEITLKKNISQQTELVKEKRGPLDGSPVIPAMKVLGTAMILTIIGILTP